MTCGLKQRLDYTDYTQIPPEGKRWELLDGDVSVTPAPSPTHQRVSKRLLHQLEAYFEARGLGEVFIASSSPTSWSSPSARRSLIAASRACQRSSWRCSRRPPRRTTGP